MKGIHSKIVAFFFLSLIGFFFLNSGLHIISDIKSTENRSLAKKPKADINLLDNFPGEYNAYYEDHFSLRNRLISLHSTISTRIFRKKIISNQVIQGKDGWLFMIEKDLINYRGTNLFTSKELELFLAEFEYRQQWLKKKDIKMYLVIVPDKYAIYSEYLPAYLKKGEPSRVEQVQDYFRQHSEIPVYYLADSLRKYKGDIPLYYKYDTHWNEYGAFCFSRILTSLLQKDSIYVMNHSITNYKMTSRIRKQGNLSKMLSGSGVYHELAYELVPGFTAAQAIDTIKYSAPENFSMANRYQFFFTNYNPKLSDVLIIRDSFGDNIMPYLKNNFNNSTFIFDAWRYGSNFQIIENEEPDVVIYLILEDLLHNVLKKLTPG
jgi:alginate O-acetyltransferase complex protein AlgJ